MFLIFILHVCVHCTVGLHTENTSYMHIRKILLLRYCCVHSFTISLLKPIYKSYINLYISVIVPAVYELQEIPTDRTEAAPHLQNGNQTEQLQEMLHCLIWLDNRHVQSQILLLAQVLRHKQMILVSLNRAPECKSISTN